MWTKYQVSFSLNKFHWIQSQSITYQTGERTGNQVLFPSLIIYGLIPYSCGWRNVPLVVIYYYSFYPRFYLNSTKKSELTFYYLETNCLFQTSRLWTPQKSDKKLLKNLSDVLTQKRSAMYCCNQLVAPYIQCMLLLNIPKK